MSTLKYCLFVLCIILLYAIFECRHTIFPVIREGEYFIDENDVIHQNHCPYRSVPCFTTKHSKFDFLKVKGTEFCDECFDDYEIETMMILHHRNLDREINRLMREGASEEYIANMIDGYE